MYNLTPHLIQENIGDTHRERNRFTAILIGCILEITIKSQITVHIIRKPIILEEEVYGIW